MDYKQLHDWCWRWKFAWRIRNHTLGGVQNIHVCVIVVIYVGVANASVKCMCLLMCLYVFVYCIHTCLCSRWEVWFILANWHLVNKLVGINDSLLQYIFITVSKLHSSDLRSVNQNKVFNKSIGSKEWFFINQTSVVHAFSFTPSLQGWWQTTSSISGRAYVSSRERWCVILNNLVMIVCIAFPPVSGYILHTILFC